MSLSKTLHPLLSTGSTQEDPSRHDKFVLFIRVFGVSSVQSLADYFKMKGCAKTILEIKNLQ